jgi:hypothetical protein
VILTLRNGETRARRLEDVVPAGPDEIRARFQSARAIESFIDDLERREDVGLLCGLLSAQAAGSVVRDKLERD